MSLYPIHCLTALFCKDSSKEYGILKFPPIHCCPFMTNLTRLCPNGIHLGQNPFGIQRPKNNLQSPVWSLLGRVSCHTQLASCEQKYQWPRHTKLQLLKSLVEPLRIKDGRVNMVNKRADKHKHPFSLSLSVFPSGGVD